MAKDKPESMTKQSIINSAKAEVNKDIGEKYKKEYKYLLKQKADTQKILGNINREIEDLELRMENELE